MQDSNPAIAATPGDSRASAGAPPIQHITSRPAEVGGIPIHRAVPTRERRIIGPWCFLDHIGPADFEQDATGMQVGPHPHIGLQTFTWMIAGEILHRDSLGTEQLIRPGQVNLMTAGRGIAHTESQPPGQPRLHAAQLWIALPAEHRNTEPRFDHYPTLPHWKQGGVNHTLLVGHFSGQEAPTLTFSAFVGVDLVWDEACELNLTLQAGFEYGLLVLEGSVTVDGECFESEALAYLGQGRTGVSASADPGARVLLLGGEPLGHEVLMWWNFVGCDKGEIAQAQRDWEANDARFAEVPGSEGMRRLMPPPLPWPGV